MEETITVFRGIIQENGDVVWSETSSLPTTRVNATAVTIDKVIYVIGGEYNNENATKTVFKGVIQNNGSIVWSETAKLPEFNFNASIVANDKAIYMIGGNKAVPLAKKDKLITVNPTDEALATGTKNIFMGVLITSLFP